MTEENEKNAELNLFSSSSEDINGKIDSPWNDKKGNPSIIIGIVAGIVILTVAYSSLSLSSNHLHKPPLKDSKIQEELDAYFLKQRGRSVEDSKQKAGFFYSLICGRLSHPSFCD